MNDAAGLERRWLSLLLEDASAGELDRHRTDLLVGVDDAGRARIEEDARRAHRIRELLQDRERQASELSVLNDLARGLGTLRDPREVLDGVAREARRFLSTDIAYLMLLNDDEELQIEVANGSIGSTLRGIRLGRGVGLGGRVLAEGRPLWTEDYLGDGALDHADRVDDAASSERIGGILAVPLLVGGETIGILCAADRRPRTFTDHEVGMLAALASHAAVAIQNARLFDRAQATATELREINSSVLRSVHLHDRLMATVLHGGGLAQVVAALQEVMDVRVAPFDAHDRPLLPGDATRVLDDERLAAVLGNRPGREVLGHDRATEPRVRGDEDRALVLPIVLRGAYSGCLLVTSDAPLNDDVVRLAERGATVVALVLASERAVSEVERRVRGELVAALLTDGMEESDLRRRARSAGLDLDAIRSVVVVDADDKAAGRRVCQDLAERTRGWTAEHDGAFVVLVPEDPVATRARVDAVAGSGLPGVAGLAAADGGTNAIRAAYLDAKRVTVVLRALSRHGALAEPAELGVYRTLFSRAGRDDIGVFVRSVIGALLDHDTASDSDLVLTLGTYLDHARHHSDTSAALHVHVNTLYARLTRITEVLGEDWRLPDRALDVHLAIRLHALERSLAARD